MGQQSKDVLNSGIAFPPEILAGGATGRAMQRNPDGSPIRGQMQAGPGAVDDVSSWKSGTYEKPDPAMFDKFVQLGGGATPPVMPPAGPLPQEPSGRRGLGLGLGLNPNQRAGFQAAVQSGKGEEYMGRNLANRVQNRVEAGSPQEARLQAFLATGESQRPYNRAHRNKRGIL